MSDQIVLHNIRVNNLDIPKLELEHGKLHVFCGPSGSGKSSLAFDVIYAEADRLGQASGVSRVFRKSSKTGQVEGIPQVVIGIEQQLTHHNMIESVAWHLGLVTAHKAWGICPKCGGKGYCRSIASERLIKKPESSPTGGAFSRAVKSAAKLDTARWRDLCKNFHGVEATDSWLSLPAYVHQALLYGDPAFASTQFKGIIPALRAAMAAPLKGDLAEEMRYYITHPCCDLCQGTGLVSECKTDTPNPLQQPLGKLPWPDDDEKWLKRLGLENIQASAPLFSQSSSTARKLRFFAVLKGLHPAALVLFDEPAAGLTRAEAENMGNLLVELRKQGHMVIAVDHRPEILAMADVVTAFGPGSGFEGGHIVFQGAWGDYKKKSSSQAKTLPESRVRQQIKKNLPPKRTSLNKTSVKDHLLHGKFRNWYNFSDFEINIPLGKLICVTGPGGSGKTAYVDAVFATCDKTPTAWQGRTTLLERSGQDQVRRPHMVDASPIGFSTASTPATYTSLWDKIRDVFATLPEARRAHQNKSHFSFNTQEGRCPNCKGRGYLCSDDIHFEECPMCGATRFKKSVLTACYHGKNISQINALTIRQATEIFKTETSLSHHLEYFAQVALEYLVIGQPSNTLSGGENLRVKLVKLLSARLGERSLYVMDNPCRGIGDAAIPLLARALKFLTRDHSVIVAENDPTFAKFADWIIELDMPRNNKLNIIYQGSPRR